MFIRSIFMTIVLIDKMATVSAMNSVNMQVATNSDVCQDKMQKMIESWKTDDKHCASSGSHYTCVQNSQCCSKIDELCSPGEKDCVPSKPEITLAECCTLSQSQLMATEQLYCLSLFSQSEGSIQRICATPESFPSTTAAPPSGHTETDKENTKGSTEGSTTPKADPVSDNSLSTEGILVICMNLLVIVVIFSKDHLVRLFTALRTRVCSAPEREKTQGIVPATGDKEGRRKPDDVNLGLLGVRDH